MKKSLIMLIALISMVSFATLAVAEEKKAVTTQAKSEIEVIKGKIASIDTKTNSVVIKDEKSGVEKTVVVTAKEIASLKVDQEVKVKCKAGSNVAISIKEIKKTKGEGKK